MIIRSIGVRQGRKALAQPLVRTCFRALATEPPSNAHDGLREAAAELDSPSPSSSTVSDNTVGDYLTYRHVQRTTKPLGTSLATNSANARTPYRPVDLLVDPPAPKDVTLELLVAAQAHMGHHPSRWHVANARFIAGVRHGIHVIRPEATAAHLRRAARVVEGVAQAGGLLLFVGTRKGQRDAVVRAAEIAGGGACHLFGKWTPGTITNRDRILDAGTLKVVNERDEEVPGFERHLEARRPLAPDLVICLNPMENYTMLRECALEGIPTVGIIDTDCDPTLVTYVIPANDDSLRCTTIVAGVLGRAAQIGRSKRIQAAKQGIVTWETPNDIQKFMARENQARLGNAEEEIRKQSKEQSWDKKAGLFGKAGLQAVREAVDGVDKPEFSQEPQMSP